MKRTLPFLLLLAATIFTTALHAQGHFDWVKIYNGVPDNSHRTDINAIVGSVADSDGNLYILGEFTPGAQIDGTDLLPFAPYGSDNYTYEGKRDLGWGATIWSQLTYTITEEEYRRCVSE